METTGWINVTILLAVLAVALHTAGFVAPMWIWLDVDSFQVGVGLWFTTGCGIEGTCSTTKPNISFGYSADDTFSQPQFNAVRGLETAALAGTVLLLLFIVVYRVGYDKWTNMEQLNMAVFITSIAIWMCILAGLIVYCAYYWPVVGTSPLINAKSFPWSMVMCLFAAFFFILVSVLIRAKCRDRAYLKDAIPIAGDSNMEQYPVTKHGLMHRYFVPLYRGLRGQQNPAIGYQSEEVKAVNNMNTRLVEAEEHGHVAAIDNAAFYADNRYSQANSANYRYLQNQNQGGQTATHDQQTETVIRRSLPTAVVTYTDATANDSHHLRSPAGAAEARLYEMDQQAHRAATGRDAMFHHVDDHQRSHGMTEQTVVTKTTHEFREQQQGGVRGYDVRHRQEGIQARDVTGQQTRDVMARDVTEHQGGVSPRDAAYQASESTYQRGGGMSDARIHQDTGGAGSREDRHQTNTATRDLVNQTSTEATRNVVHQFGSGEAHHHREAHGRNAAATSDVVNQTGMEARRGVVHQSGGGEAYLREGRDNARDAAHHNGDVVMRGRGAAARDAFGNLITEERVVTTTTTTTYVTEEGREKRGGLKVTEFVSQDAEGTQQHGLSSWASTDSVRPYDPTYIYRPYSETV